MVITSRFLGLPPVGEPCDSKAIGVPAKCKGEKQNAKRFELLNHETRVIQAKGFCGPCAQSRVLDEPVECKRTSSGAGQTVMYRRELKPKAKCASDKFHTLRAR